MNPLLYFGQGFAPGHLCHRGVQARYQCAQDPITEIETMTTPITLENSYCKFTFMKAPKQVKKAADLPNWFITLVKKDGVTSEKVYLQIQTTDGLYPVDLQDGLNAADYIECVLQISDFIGQFGELQMDLSNENKPAVKTQRVAKEFYNFFQRRGRNVRTVMESVPGKRFNPITMRLDNDLLFTTTQSHSCFKRNYKCISGMLTALGQIHHFELSHPLFDLSMIMTAGDARKIIVAGLRKAFPFIDAADIKNWAFDNQVQGK